MIHSPICVYDSLKMGHKNDLFGNITGHDVYCYCSNDTYCALQDCILAQYFVCISGRMHMQESLTEVFKNILEQYIPTFKP